LGGGGANAAPSISGAGGTTHSGAGAGAGAGAGGVVAGAPTAGGNTSSSGAAAAGDAGTAEGGAPAGNPGFVHPGLLLTNADLARMKAKIASQADPWHASFTTLAADSHSSSSKTFAAPPAIIGRNAASAYATTRYAAEDAAVTAFQNALVYALNGDAAHAAKVVEILNAYASTTQHFDAVDPERDLEAAILGFLWVSAAELIRYSDYTGWSATDLAKFDAWIRGVVYADTSYNASGVLVTPLVNGAGARGAFGLRTKLAIGVYLDDHGIYDEAIDYFFNGQGNGAPHYYVKPDTGQTWEAGRDQGHAQGGLSRLVETAHIAYNQGNPSLYAWQDNALLRAVEYIAGYNLGNDVAYSPMQPYTLDWSAVYPAISAIDRGMLATIYELPYSYFHSTLGLAMPYAEQAIAKEGVELFSAQNDNPMFATLSYRR
jgi:hypothetical protein